MGIMVYTPYLDKVYEPARYKKLVARVAKNMVKLKKTLRFQAIAFRGSSGAALAYPVSAMTGIPLIHVRKAKEKSHGNPVEGSGHYDRYIILDDFISSGTTVKKIYSQINTEADGEPIVCVGIALYNESREDRKQFLFTPKVVVPVKEV